MRTAFKWAFSLLTDKRPLSEGNSISWFPAFDTMNVSGMDDSILASCAPANCYCISVTLCMLLDICIKRVIIGERAFRRRRKVERHSDMPHRLIGLLVLQNSLCAIL